ncbi:Cardiolipin synthetase [Mesoflavibacter sp. HG96]|uniref:cardiolipin synthase n=1 Tax=Mesoflavibacter TaxID=444051 RepID=UPI000D0F9D87|nr:MULTISPECIES: cardiolipin synthase [Mesoflavibacter]QIJ87908.1 Cardiolipin synthetase [Mesoflavibacter sp. HG96]QIJ90636.1 Cardiolipin synthetase [Mesoflavibacter sp. HG37]
MLAFLTDHWWTIAIVINYILALLAVVTILFKSINPTKTLTYIIVLLVFPFFGLIVYYLFGQEYRKNKIFNRKDVLNNNLIKSINSKVEIKPEFLSKYEANAEEEQVRLVQLLQKNDKSPLTQNNEVEIILNGENKFEKLFQDIKQAKKHVHLEYYILKDDKIGTRLLDLLLSKAKEGVVIRLSYDDVGSKISSKMKKLLNQSTIQHHAFMPVLFPKFTGKMNYRNHRKIVIIDGEIGYVGGVNVSDTYVNYPENKNYWRDTHLRIEGEAVFSLQTQFLTNWNFVAETEVKLDRSFFPSKPIDKIIPIQIAASGPDTDWANIMEAIFFSIVTAEKYVYITTPYFIPNDQIITAMQVAAKSGVDVRLLIPDISDSWTAQHATNSYLEQLFEANIKIYRYTKGFIHAKTMVVDDIFTTIGTSNMDYRSFNINFEINALIYNEEKAKEAKQIFLDDLKDAKNITFEQWTNRPKIERLKEAYCRLWAPLL